MPKRQTLHVERGFRSETWLSGAVFSRQIHVALRRRDYRLNAQFFPFVPWEWKKVQRAERAYWIRYIVRFVRLTKCGRVLLRVVRCRSARRAGADWTRRQRMMLCFAGAWRGARSASRRPRSARWPRSPNRLSGAQPSHAAGAPPNASKRLEAFVIAAAGRVVENARPFFDARPARRPVRRSSQRTSARKCQHAAT
jgi:hypothetical protein